MKLSIHTVYRVYYGWNRMQRLGIVLLINHIGPQPCVVASTHNGNIMLRKHSRTDSYGIVPVYISVSEPRRVLEDIVSASAY